MTPELQALARRAVACKHWRWLPGMLSIETDDTSAYGTYPCRVRRYPYPANTRDPIPDLSDPATLGCLLALVREAWATQVAWVEPGHDGLWEACIYVSGKARIVESYDSEAAALVAALEAAPCD